MAEFGFSAKVNADVSGFQKGMLKAEKSLNKFAKGIEGIGKKGIVGSLANITLAMGGVATAFKTATKIVKEVAKAVGECTEAYKAQAIAERSLQTAIDNNPYISGTSLNALKQFASEMQAVTNYGDEQILQLETQLVSLGRTEEETMKIIKVATDMASSGTVSLDTAITQLNATLNGNIGRLGQQNAELKALTEEELKSGKAIDILGEKFKGLSSATIDTSKQLQNIKGDFKEAIGEFTLPSSDMWNKFWMGFYQKGIDVVHALQASLDSSRGEGIYEKLAGSIKKIKDEEQKRWMIEEALTNSNTIELNQLQTYLEGIKKRNKQEELTLDLVKQTLQYRKDAEEAVERGRMLEEQDEAKRQKALDEQFEAENKIAKLKEEYLEKVAEQEAKWKNTETVTGEVVENEEKITFYQNALVDLMTQAGGQISTNNQLYKDQIAIIQKLQAELKPEEKKTSDEWAKKLREQTIARLEAEKESELERLNLEEATDWEIINVTKYYNERLLELNRQRIEEERQQALDSVKDYANAEEERARINKYYDEEILNNQKEFVIAYNSQNKIIAQNFAGSFKNVIKSAQEMSNKIIRIFSGIAKTIKSMFSTSKSLISKMFNFNVDDALDSLLAFEDKVLTFFVETLPKIPQFIESAFQSIDVLINTILDTVDFDTILNSLLKTLTNIINKIPKLITKLLPKLLQAIKVVLRGLVKIVPELLKVGGELIAELFKGLPKFVENELPVFLNELLRIIPVMFGVGSKFILGVAKMLPTIVQALIDAFIEILKDPKQVAELVVGLIKAFVEVINVLIRNMVPLLEALLPAIATIILEIFKALPQLIWEMMKSIGNLFKDLAKWIANLVIDGINGLLDGISSLWTWIGIPAIPHIPHFANGTNDAPRGLALVGEQGPELVQFSGGERVLNNRNTQKALSGAGGGNVFNVTFENTIDTTAFAMMKQLKQYQRNLAFNGVL